MLTQMLITAGKEAMYYRNHDGENSVAHKEALDKIEEITHHIKTQNPEKFWQDDDPEYQKMTRQWAKHRAQVMAKVAAEKAIKAAKLAD